MFNQAQQIPGAFNFAPSAAEIVINAFWRIQVRPTEILAQHIQQATLELNLLMAKMDNLGPNLWTVDLQTQALAQGTFVYPLPSETIMITNAFIRTGSGTSTNDRLIFPISQTEYDSLPNKFSQGFPNQFWFDRLISPTITLFPVPDANGPYVLFYHRVRYVSDVTLENSFNIEVPVRWLDAVTAGLAYRLARVFRPDLEQIRKMDADEAWRIAATQDVENVPLMIAPGIGGYYLR